MNLLETKRNMVLSVYPTKIVPLIRASYSKGEVTMDATDFHIQDLRNLGFGTIQEFKEYLPDITFTYEGKNY